MSKDKYRGLNTKGEFVYGSLVTTTHGIKHRPKQHSKTWIVETAFGNGGWFSVQRRQYVKPETVGQFSQIQDSNGDDIYAGDVVYLAGLGNMVIEFPFIDLYMSKMEKDVGAIIGNIHTNPELLEAS